MGRHESHVFAAVRTTAFEWPKLPRVTARQIALEAFLFAGPRKTTHTFQGRSITVTGPLWDKTQDRGLVAKIRFGENVFFALLPTDFLPRLLRLQGHDGDVARWDTTAKALVLDHLIGDLLAPLEAGLGGPVSVENFSAAPIAFAGKTLSFRVNTADEEGFFFHIAAEPDRQRDLAALCSQNTPRPRVPSRIALPFVARVCLPVATVARDQLTALRRGDGLVLDTEWTARRSLCLDIQSHFAARVSHTDGRITLSSPLCPLPPTYPERTAQMNQQSKISPTTQDDRTDGLPVRITVELGRTTLSLSQIRDLAVGGVVPFADELTTKVRLYANDVPFGRGDLVRFDDKVAVRLTDID